MLFEGLSKQPPSLVDLCVRTAIDNVRYIGYVGGVDFHLLEKILQHCTLEQLMHIEDSTHDTDLSPVTNKLWKRFYEKKYGEKSLNLVMERMKRNKVNFEWRQLYEAKLKDVQEAEKEAVARLKQLYKKEDAKKQSRQTKLCVKAPPSRKPFWGNSGSGYNVSNVKSNIMRKSRLELLKSQEVKNLTAIKRNTISKSFSISAPRTFGLSANAPSTSRTVSCAERNLPPKRNNSLTGTAPSTSRSVPCVERNLPPKRINSLPGTAPSRSLPCVERNLPIKRINSLPGTFPSTSRSVPCVERNPPPKRINSSLTGTVPSSTSRSVPCVERNLPSKRISSLTGTVPSSASRSVPCVERKLPLKSLSGTAPSTSRYAGTKRKLGM